jgi:photosystem II stability/assembly factor-like uncharacterized protein
MQKLKRTGIFFLLLLSGLWPSTGAQAGDLGPWTLDSYFPTNFVVSLIEITQEDVLLAVGGTLLPNDEISSCSIYRKNNFADQWNLVSSTPICFNNLTSSSDGMRLVAAAWGSDIYTSSDGGKNWVNRNKPDWWWFGFSSSSSGQTVIGTTEKRTFWISHDYGVSWNAPFAEAPSSNSFTNSAISADGNKMIIGDYFGYLYVSTDGGKTWRTSGNLKGWSGVAISSNGSRMFATASNEEDTPGGIFLSLDDGNSWTQIGADNSWGLAGITPNGNHAYTITADEMNNLFVSNDFGKSWQAISVQFSAGSVAIYNSGQYVFALLNSSVGDWPYQLYFAEYKCGVGGVDTCAEAAAAAKREAEKKLARDEISNKFKNSLKVTIENFKRAEIIGITSENIDAVQAEILALPEGSRSDIVQILKVARKYEVIGKVASDQVKSIQSNEYIEIGLISSTNKNKIALVSAIRKLPAIDRDSYAEVKSAIDTEMATIQARKDRTAAIKNRISSRGK